MRDERHLLIVYFLNSLFDFAHLIGFEDFTDIHREMCDDLVNFLMSPKPRRKRAMWLYPRGFFKTSLFSVAFPLWAYLQSFYGIGPLEPLLKSLKAWGNGGLRVLLAGSTADNASRRLVMIEKVVETNEKFRAIFTECVPENYHNRTWNTTACEMPRKGLWQEPTFETIGVGGKITGRHYLMAVKDDLVGEEDLGPDGLPKPSAIREVIQWHSYFDSLFQSPGKAVDIIVGTRWGEEDFAGYIIKEDRRYQVFKRQAIEEEKPTFPERISMEFLEDLKKRQPYIFATQYMNDVDDETLTEFKSSWIQDYRWVSAPSPESQILLRHPDGHEEPLNVQYLDRTLIVDPAFSKKRKSDPTGMLVLGQDHNERIFVLAEWTQKLLPEELINVMLRLAKEWRVRTIGVESVSAQRTVIHFARYIMQRENFYVPISPIQPSTRISKHQRIRGVIPLMFAGRIWMDKSRSPELLEEIKHFPTGKDHLLDCLAYWGEILKVPPPPPAPAKAQGRFLISWEDLFAKKHSKLYQDMPCY